MQHLRKWLFKPTRITMQILRFSLAQGSRRFSLIGLIGLPAEIVSLVKYYKEVLWPSYFGQQSDHGRCIAKIGEENVG